MQSKGYVRDISALRIIDAEDAGGKGAKMRELVAAKLPVPSAQLTVDATPAMSAARRTIAAAERRLLLDSVW